MGLNRCNHNWSYPLQNEDSLILKFICWYHKAPPKAYGIDTTVTLPMALKISHAREYLGLIEDTLFVKIIVPGPGSNQEYIVPAPTVKPYTTPGQATCEFVGYNLQRHVKVFIKDTWWVDLLDIEKEGDTYVVMVAAQVKNIVPCSAAGDIGDHTTSLIHSKMNHGPARQKGSWFCITNTGWYWTWLENPSHFLIITADVMLCVGCIDRYVINMYCTRHN